MTDKIKRQLSDMERITGDLDEKAESTERRGIKYPPRYNLGDLQRLEHELQEEF